MIASHTRVALVTGASRGIGAATARLLAESGIIVVVNYLKNSVAAEQLIDTIHRAGGAAHAIQADVQNISQVAHLVAQVEQAYSRIDILISNAPVSAVPKPFLDQSWEEFAQPINADLRAAFVLTQAVAPLMIKQHYGRIVYTASNLARRPGFPGASAIGTAKAGLVGLTKYIAQELGTFGITANAVGPGMVETDLSAMMSSEQRARIATMTPLGRIAQPEDIARVIRFFATDDSGFMTGSYAPVSGGMFMD